MIEHALAADVQLEFLSSGACWQVVASVECTLDSRQRQHPEALIAGNT
jgi:hypothetical protein